MSNHTILVCDNFGKEFLDRLSKFGKVLQSSDIDYNLPLEEVTVLVVRSKTKVNKNTVDVMKKLECVITATHGLDHIDQPYLAERGISFYNVPAQSYDVAQGVIAYILAHATNLVEGDRSMKQGQWKKTSLIGCRVTGKTLGVVGCGKIGREVARLGCALGMNVVVFDPCISDDGTVTLVCMEDLVKAADFISVNCPLTNGTRDLIGEKELAIMKDGVFLVNTARGGIINERALLDSLNAGKVGAALDVLVSKTPFEDEIASQLIQHESVIVTPHSIGQTYEAVQEKGEGVIKAIEDHISKNC
ncbi:MAG: NAD(P)-dependent oxidoreductase [Candidatus Bathyarchaeota archaeon]|nr:NAD(P)-dependent oxidoreductase [Candidatus Bathyarchaeum tardum]WGM89225.1 MAG: NAD(P)-dependent oxidoreductase [Candidatus Bathyarchaeum tardum]